MYIINTINKTFTSTLTNIELNNIQHHPFNAWKTITKQVEYHQINV